MNIAINGFGRIGRAALKVLFEKRGVNIVAINDLGDIENLAYLLKYDSVYGVWDKKIEVQNNYLKINSRKIEVLSEREPNKLPWKKMNVDVVIESTGFFTDLDGLKLHLKAGAKKVVLSAPAKSDNVPTYVRGVNCDSYKNEAIISNASCTTNCSSPVASVINEKFGIIRAGLTTIHAYTSSQNMVDTTSSSRKKDFRCGRAAAINMSPTSTGAAKATALVIPDLDGIFDGIAVRVPIACGSLSDLTFLVEKKTTVEEVNRALASASKGKMKGILEVSNEQLVSSDIVGTCASAIVDLEFTRVIGGDFVKILAWYDNEWAYAHRLVEISMMIG